MWSVTSVLVCALSLSGVDEPQRDGPSVVRVGSLPIAIQDASARHVRALEPKILSLIDAGLSGSETFRGLIATLDESDVIGYAEPKLTRRALGGYLAHNIVAQGQYRNHHIAVEMAGSERRLVSLLAHELQHAVEVAHAPDARDAPSLERTFSRLAIKFGCSGTTCFDTQPAKDVEHIVKEEFAAPLLSHLRTDNTSITAAIQTGLEHSKTFKRLVDTINRTDGIVYVARGTCGHRVRACLVLEVTPSGSNRLLRILIDAHKVDSDLIGSIGHELQHAVEVLSKPSVTNNIEIYNFYHCVAPTDKGRFETEAAIRAGLDVLAEVHAWAKGRGLSPAGAGQGLAAEASSTTTHVRSDDSALAGLINQATRGSETFRRLLATIEASNGIVYVEPGACGHGVRACLTMWMQVSGPNRFVRIVINRSKPDRDLEVRGSIGHELQHAIEVLREPAVTNGVTMFNFLMRMAPTDSNRFETTADIDAGDALIYELRARRGVGHELRAWDGRTKDPSIALAPKQLADVPRVRSEDPALARLITQGSTQSSTFRHELDVISHTNGLVYVSKGRCGHSVHACLVPTVDLAGPFRLLHIQIDRQRSEAETIGLIGHELWHAIEALSDPSITNNAAIELFFLKFGGHGVRPETSEAVHTGDAVFEEVKSGIRRQHPDHSKNH
jgi:hypothetical protein